MLAHNITNSSYDLATIKERRCDKYGLNSQFSTRLDSQSAFDSFTQNSFPNSVMHLPGFEENAHSTTSVLSWMTRIETARDDFCLEETSTKDPGQSWSFPSLILVPFLILFQCGLALRAPGPTPPAGNDPWVEFTIGCLCLSVLQLWFEVLWFVFVYFPFHELKKYIQRLDLLGCFVGNQGQIVIKDYLEVLGKIEAGFWVHFVIFILSTLPTFVFVWYWIVKKRTSHQ